MRFGFATPLAASTEHVDYGFLDEIKKAGYDFAELPGILISRLTDAEFDDLYNWQMKEKLPVLGICYLFPGSLSVFSEDIGVVRTYLEKLFPRLEALRIKNVGFGSGQSRWIPQGIALEKGKERFVDVIKEEFLPLAKKHSLRILIEPLRTTETNFINTLDQGQEILTRINDPEVMLLADTMHMMYAKEDEETIKRSISSIGHVHISEKGRILPVKKYSEECGALIGILNKLGYDQTVSFETRCSNITELQEARTLLEAEIRTTGA